MSELHLTKEAYLNSNEQRAIDDMVRTVIHEE